MADLSSCDAWGVRWRPAPGARLRLFCLPHTGGGASLYRSWAQRLPPDIELIAIRLPGRETRFREPPFTRLDELAPALVSAVRPWLDRPHAWFGHSMGSLIAFEACRILARRSLPAPVRLQVAGKPAPHLVPRQPPVHAAPTADLVDRLRLLGGTPAALLDGGALGVLLPTLRADFAVAETYTCRPAPPLDCPISVFGGTRDPLTTVAELDAWRRHSAVGGTLRMFEGGHFFPHESQEQVLPVMVADLRAALDGPDPAPTPPGDAPPGTTPTAGTTRRADTAPSAGVGASPAQDRQHAAKGEAQ